MARLVTLDVTNTCIRITSSPGYHFAKIGREFDLHLDVPQLDSAFRKAFKAHNKSHPCFGVHQGITSRDWWRMVTNESFTQVGVTNNDLKANLASRLFEDFTGPGNWELFSDVVPSLEKLQEAGVLLGVISNFDERIDSILSGLGILKYFDFVLASVRVKFAKPSPRIFKLAVERAGVETADAVHIGDDYELDYLAAKNAGMRSLLLVREGISREDIPEDTVVIDSLTEETNFAAL